MIAWMKAKSLLTPIVTSLQHQGSYPKKQHLAQVSEPICLLHLVDNSNSALNRSVLSFMPSQRPRSFPPNNPRTSPMTKSVTLPNSSLRAASASKCFLKWVGTLARVSVQVAKVVLTLSTRNRDLSTWELGIRASKKRPSSLCKKLAGEVNMFPMKKRSRSQRQDGDNSRSTRTSPQKKHGKPRPEQRRHKCDI